LWNRATGRADVLFGCFRWIDDRGGYDEKAPNDHGHYSNYFGR
jgi:hypothetical protein